MMKIKSNVIEIRAAENQLTFKQLANAAGISEKTLHAARSGAAIRTDTAGRIAAALGVPIHHLIEKEI